MTEAFDRAGVTEETERAIAILQDLLFQATVGQITQAQFKAKFFSLMRKTYKNAGAIAASDGLSSEQKALLESLLNEQFYPHGEDFSLIQRFDEYDSGLLSAAQFAVSLAMYLRSAKAAAADVWALPRGDQLVRRELRGNDHCVQCILYAALPAMRLDDIIIPGRSCNCYTNCLCEILLTSEVEVS